MENKPGKSEHKSAEPNTQRAKNAWNFFYCGSLEEEPGDELLEAMK